jgi:tight adherence protein C
MLAGHIHAVFACFVGIGMVILFLRSLSAWRDIAKLDRDQYRAMGEQLTRPLQDRLRPKTEIEIRTLKLTLTRAGWRQNNAVERYVALRVLALGVGAAAAFATVLLGFDALHVLLMGGVFVLAGNAYPDYMLRRRLEERQAKIGRVLPAVVDLMVLCLEVGLSLEASFERVTTEIADLEPLMAEEASLMLSEMSSGITFPQALNRMAERVGYEDLLTLSRLISQASLMGASITRALREYSEASFQKRVVSLEEQAGKITSMMVMPVTLCMLPAAMIALVGPAVLMLLKLIAHN